MVGQLESERQYAEGDASHARAASSMGEGLVASEVESAEGLGEADEVYAPWDDNDPYDDSTFDEQASQDDVNGANRKRSRRAMEVGGPEYQARLVDGEVLYDDEHLEQAGFFEICGTVDEEPDRLMSGQDNDEQSGGSAEPAVTAEVPLALAGSIQMKWFAEANNRTRQEIVQKWCSDVIRQAVHVWYVDKGLPKPEYTHSSLLRNLRLYHWPKQTTEYKSNYIRCFRGELDRAECKVLEGMMCRECIFQIKWVAERIAEDQRIAAEQRRMMNSVKKLKQIRNEVDEQVASPRALEPCTEVVAVAESLITVQPNPVPKVGKVVDLTTRGALITQHYIWSPDEFSDDLRRIWEQDLQSPFLEYSLGRLPEVISLFDSYRAWVLEKMELSNWMHYSCKLEVCTKATDPRKNWLHFHLAITNMKKREFVDRNYWRFRGQENKIESNCGKGRYADRSLWNADYYAQCIKIGTIFADTNWEAFYDHPVDLAFIFGLWRKYKMPSASAIEQIHKARGNGTRNYLAEIALHDQWVRETASRTERETVLSMVRMKGSKAFPEVTSWLMSFQAENDNRTRYKFLVLVGKSQVGKTRFAVQIHGAERTMVISAQGIKDIILSDFRRDKHKCIVFDEGNAELAVKHKQIFQSGLDPVQLGVSATGMHAYRVWLYAVPIIITTNEWPGKGLRSDELEWLADNAIVVNVTAPMWSDGVEQALHQIEDVPVQRRPPALPLNAPPTPKVIAWKAGPPEAPLMDQSAMRSPRRPPIAGCPDPRQDNSTELSLRCSPTQPMPVSINPNDSHFQTWQPSPPTPQEQMRPAPPPPPPQEQRPPPPPPPMMHAPFVPSTPPTSGQYGQPPVRPPISGHYTPPMQRQQWPRPPIQNQPPSCSRVPAPDPPLRLQPKQPPPPPPLQQQLQRPQPPPPPPQF